MFYLLLGNFFWREGLDVTFGLERRGGRGTALQGGCASCRKDF